MRYLNRCHFLLVACLITACGTHRHTFMFRVDTTEMQQQAQETRRNYTIQPDDALTLEVYTNRGERIIDPNRQSFREAGTTSQASPIQYRVDREGRAHLPLLGQVALQGLTLPQAEELIAEAYAEFYEEPFVVINFVNKRVVVLGAGGGHVIPLTQPYMKLSEILALAQDAGEESNAGNIRVLRGEEVFVADFRTVSGYRNSDMVMEPGDIVYLEPVRRPLTQTLREVAPLISIATSLITVIYVATQAN